jgi:hypothetical protein
MTSNVVNCPDGGISTDNDVFQPDFNYSGRYIYISRLDDMTKLQNDEKLNSQIVETLFALTIL